MKWHRYPYEEPENNQVCLIRPEKPYYYADHHIATYIVDSLGSRWVDHSHGDSYDLFEHPLWISLDEIEETAKDEF